MSYELYSNIIQDNEELILDLPNNLIFPEEDNKYFFINMSDEQNLLQISIALYGNVNHWKMLAILNKIENPMILKERKIIAVRPEYINEIING